jgi:D-aminopeptidase
MRVFTALFLLISISATAQKRARDYKIPFDGTPGQYNAITDVAGVTVGQVTIKEGSGPLVKDKGPIRTGVTAILPRGKEFAPCYAAFNALNGNGDMTGTHWIDESGFLETPILITNTGNVGIVRDAAWKWMNENKYYEPFYKDYWYAYPVVAETYDGVFNDINGQHVHKDHVFEALNKAKTGPVEEGGVGGGTGMMSYLFKGGTGTSSRLIAKAAGGYTVGVLVQANHGNRYQLMIAGVAVGKELRDTLKPVIEGLSIGKNEKAMAEKETGSIIVVLATDAPLLPEQIERLTRRIPLGLTRTGAIGGNGSGDIFIAFSTANKNAFNNRITQQVSTVSNAMMDQLFEATMQATEEAVINALFAGETMEGINGNKVYGIPKDKVVQILAKYNKIKN